MSRPRLAIVTPHDLLAIWRLIADSWRFIATYKWIMLGLGALYATAAYFLVGGVSQLDYVSFKDASQAVIGGDLGALSAAFSLFGSALTGGLSAPMSPLQQFLSATLVLFFWLTLVWAARMLSAKKDITMRDALYSSGAPVIPTLAVLSVIALQLIPAAFGVFTYATAQSGGWLAGGVESMVFAVAALLLCLLSAYFVVSSLTALVIVTLPGTYPWQALTQARELVINRRWGLALRSLSLVIHMVALWAVILVPVFLIDNWLRFDWLPLVPVFVQTLGGFTLVFTSVYIYKLYRSLL